MAKIRLLILSSLLLIGAALVFWACGTVNSGGGSTSTNLFYANTSSATPVFEPTVAAAALGARVQTITWESGTPLYSVFYTLREFLASRDEGKVDRANLYKLLIDVDTVYSGISGSLVSITEQSIASPFTQLPPVICNQALNDESGKKAGARKETTAEVDALLTWIWTDNPTKEEFGIATLFYDKLTKNITVEMTYSVDYDTSTTTTEYNLRCWVTGNTDSNTFKFKYIVGDQKIVAQGVSRGAGNYMLFKFNSSGTTEYLVVPGDADESFFIAQNTSSTEIYSNPADLPASVEAYKAWVVATDFFTSDNLLSDTSILNAGTTREGTIYLNYE